MDGVEGWVFETTLFTLVLDSMPVSHVIHAPLLLLRLLLMTCGFTS